MTRGRIVYATGAVAGFALWLLPLGAAAEVPATVSSYGSSATAGAVHVIAGSSAFPNFNPGAVDNRYTLAAVKQDASPASYAVATFEDIGPLAATLVPGAAPYARSQYPAGGKSAIDSCAVGPAAIFGVNNFWNQNAGSGAPQNPVPNPPSSAPCQPVPGIAASSAADELTAASKATMVDTGTFSGLNGAVKTVGAAADAGSVLDASGKLVTYSHSALKSVAIGPLTVNKVDVLARVTAAGGHAKTESTATIGEILYDDGTGKKTVVVRAGTDGVYIAGGKVTDVPPVDQGLEGFYHVWAAAPQKKEDGGHGVISLAALHVALVHPVPTGVPQQNVEYVIGEASADAFAVPATPAASSAPTDSSSDSAASSGVSSASGSSSASFSGSAGGAVSAEAADTGAGAPAAAGPAAATRPAAAVIPPNKRGVALLFLLWESLLMATAAAMVWARRTGAAEVA